MHPEISHRCSACGASIRDAGTGALFCPECGAALTDSSVEKAQKTDEPAASEATAVRPQQVTLPENDETTPSSDEDQGKKSVSEDRQSARERTREKLQRASKLTRGAIEDNVKRVEKIHHVSSVVLEEATYDPSLRFVLVALGLFVLAVVLLVLSKVMG
jgi:uncharacterized Zn finger protein (UPF0148 family)